MKNRIRKAYLYLSLEYHWSFIRRYRGKMEKLYDSGVGLSDPRMLKLNSRSSRHCLAVTEGEAEFLSLSDKK